ncbi:dihydrofolate reductase family protein [Streptomyces radicis]|uniref:Dihydrofolate reductase n=1 Tax=Streptomyces radicis TaxID=1750517 RepID=A0A3A9WU88_9ACTN|nr:dihydrofolate reductase family protein [Streptomyces radicis]RKN11356.1 dihydrofolate reductase [Streptomyces radicis]RKN26621.1 dihydrofolate reductase [Streptomyces radicis]
MRVTLTEFLTLDGVVQSPGMPDEDTRGGFRHGGWQFPYADEDFGRLVAGWFGRADAFLLGRWTYDIFAGHWPRMTDPDDPVASALNGLPKYVVTGTPLTTGWEGATALTGDLADEVGALRRRPGRELQIWGSATLARSLLGLGLVDELRLLIHPVVLGEGLRLFDTRDGGVTPAALKLTGTATTGSGVVLHTYEPLGTPRYGAFPAPD